MKWTTAKEDAALAIAQGTRTHAEIAAAAGVARSTLYEWQAAPEFAARVREIVAGWQKSCQDLAIADKRRRVERMSRDWLRGQQVIEERAGSAEMQGAPGGKTGLLTMQLKSIVLDGMTGERQIVPEYEVDTGLLAELRALEEQAAIELGQRLRDPQPDGPRVLIVMPGGQVTGSSAVRAGGDPVIVQAPRREITGGVVIDVAPHKE